MEKSYGSNGGPRDQLRHRTHERVHVAVPKEALRTLSQVGYGMFSQGFRAYLERQGVAFEGDEPVKPWKGTFSEDQVVFLGWRAKQ